MPSSESLHSQEPQSSKQDSPKPESRLTLNELSPEVKPFAMHLSEYILSICKKHGIESNFDTTTDNSNLSQAVSDAVAMYIEKLSTDPSLMADAKKLIQLQNRLTSIHEQNKISEEQEGDLHFIDLSSDLLSNKWKKAGWEIVKHEGEGFLELDPSRLQLYLSPRQQDGHSILGTDLLIELEKDHIPVLNACVLDYLLAHPELIPEDWKNRGNIYFPATQFRLSKRSQNDRLSNVLFVKCLWWHGGAWGMRYDLLDNNLNDLYPAAILANIPQS